MAEHRLDELDRAPRPDQPDRDLDLLHGQDAEDVEGEPRDRQGVTAAALPVLDLDGVRHHAEGGGDVLLVGRPGAADVLGRGEGVVAGAEEVGHAAALSR